MSGVFLSYSRGDRVLAHQIVRALRALDVEVWWDEDMPGVDWQDELARQINELAAVLVIWTPLSTASKNVRDEARLGQHKEKLVNVMVGVASPPFPFDRVNGLPLDGWTGRERHGGWTRVIRTIEERMVAAGAMKSGKLTAALRTQEQSVADKQRAVAEAEAAFVDAKTAEAESSEAIAGARDEFTAAEVQLRSVIDIQAGPALLRAAQQQLDAALVARTDAEQACRSAAATLARASRSLAGAKSELEMMFDEPDRAPRRAPDADATATGPDAAKVRTPERPARAPKREGATARSLLWRPIAAAAGIGVILIGLWLLVGHRGPATTAASSTPVASSHPAPGRVFRDCADVCPEMVAVPAGKFTMGSPDTEPGRDPDEGPQHTVSISYPLAIGKYPITFHEWDACVAAGGCGGYRPSDQGWGRDDRPVINVNWADAQSYAQWLSAKTGHTYRLLSQAEYEYAVRAGTTTAYYWGNDVGSGHANCNGCGSQWDDKQTSPVGSFAANGLGLYDMLGDVWSWTQDCYAPSYAGAPTDGSASTSGECTERVLRGGSWANLPWLLRAATRYGVVPGNRGSNNGFRLARTR